VPVGFAETEIHENDPNYLSLALRNHLKEKNAIFDFRIQPQTDAEAMPVENATIEWPESLSAPISVATLTIPVQDVDSPEGNALTRQCEAMAFSPWNALKVHQPTGGINRLRKKVYEESQKMRAQQNKS
jgi:hypothetical protein